MIPVHQFARTVRGLVGAGVKGPALRDRLLYAVATLRASGASDADLESLLRAVIVSLYDVRTRDRVAQMQLVNVFVEAFGFRLVKVTARARGFAFKLRKIALH